MSSATRTLYIHRRRPHLVDLIVPKLPGVDTYRIKWTGNFDQPFTTIINSTNVGHKDSSINIYSLTALNTSGIQVRIAFDPSNYSINDAAQFWLQFVPVIGGVEQTAEESETTIVLPESVLHGAGAIIVSGTAPNVAFGSSLPLGLPNVFDTRIVNNSTSIPLMVSMDINGPEYTVTPGKELVQLRTTQSDFWVRGSGGTAPFSMTCTLANG